MKLDAVQLETLALRGEKLNELLFRIKETLDGGATEVKPLIFDAYGKYSPERMEGFLDELTQGWGMYEIYQKNWDFASAVVENGGKFVYEWGADSSLARDFLYCALRFVSSCPWFFAGTLAEVKRLAAHLGTVTSESISDEDGKFSYLVDVYSAVGPKASFFENMDALYRLLTEDERLPEAQQPEDAREFLAMMGFSSGIPETQPWLETLEHDVLSWKASFADVEGFCARYTAFRDACRTHPSCSETLAEDVSFALDVLLSNHGIAQLMNNAAYFSCYQQLLNIEAALENEIERHG